MTERPALADVSFEVREASTSAEAADATQPVSDLEVEWMKARAAVNAAGFSSSLLPGYNDEATVLEFLHRRREEIVAVASGALQESADVLSAEEILRLLYREVP